MNALANQAWGWLEGELERWSDAGLHADFWWRDDDAVAPGDALDHLLSLSTRHRVPLSLAVIPARLESGLATYLAPQKQVSVLQHGYAHRSHAAPGQRKLELGGTRDTQTLVGDLQSGLKILEDAFGEQLLPVLVPPWNRIDAALLTQLPAIGLRGISTMKARRSTSPVAGLLQVNAHLDPIHWRRGGGFIGVYPALAILIQHLIARRTGYRDRDEPTGLLTHHLAQNEAVWHFTADLLQFISDHPATSWTDAPTLWQQNQS